MTTPDSKRHLTCLKNLIEPEHLHQHEEEVYLPRHRFVKARGHPPHTLQKYQIAFATSHKAPEQIHKLLF